MAFHILQRNKNGGRQLANTLLTAISEVGNCQKCRTLSELALCSICLNPGRGTQFVMHSRDPSRYSGY